MQVAVEEEVVGRNVERFQRFVREVVDSVRTTRRQQVGFYSASVHRASGEIAFERDYSFSSKKWKRLEVCLRVSREGGVTMEVGECSRNAEAFCCEEISKHALHILAQTIKTLNALAEHVKASHDFKRLLRQIAQMSLEVKTVSLTGKEIVHEAWHDVDRLGAEKVLEEQIVGTFLFRKDRYAQWLEARLCAALRREVQCVTLTYRRQGGVSDLTVVQREGRWMVYADDPSLQAEASYASAALLCEHVQGLLGPLAVGSGDRSPLPIPARKG